MDQKHGNVRYQIEKMVSYRKELPSGIYQIHKELTNRQVHYLNNIRINLQTLEIDSLTPEDIYENFRTEEQKDHLFNKKVYDHIQLLEIIKSKNSAIQEIIDNI